MSGALGSTRRLVVDRVGEVARSWRGILRLTIAPALAWWLSLQLFGHGQAFFAPIAAVLTLTVGVGQRATVVLEIVVGAALGILVGELFILSIGRGFWQLILVVALAVVSAKLIRLPGVAVTQAVISAVLLVAIVPAPGVADPAINRFVDALLGGAVALGTIVLIPANPLREIDLGLHRLRAELARILGHLADALRSHDAAWASAALDEARNTQTMVDTLGSLTDSLSEVARISPFRWGQRPAVLAQTAALVNLDHAVRNTRVMTRRAAAMLRNGETAPVGIVHAMEALSGLAAREDAAIEELVAVARLAIVAAAGDLTINTAAIASQVRAVVADLLLAHGVDPDKLDDLLGVD